MSLPYRPELHEWGGVPPHIWYLMTRRYPKPKRPWRRRDRKGGRPRLDPRLTFSGILWKLRSGATWSRMPKRFGSARTVQRRLAHLLYNYRLQNLFRRMLECGGDGLLGRWEDCFNAHRYRRDFWWVYFLEEEYRRYLEQFPPRQKRVEKPSRWALPSSPAGEKA